MEATPTARQEPATVRATSRTRTLGTRASAQRSQSTAQGRRTQAQCCLQKSATHVHVPPPSIHVPQIFPLLSTRALHRKGLCPVPEHRYPRPLWSVLLEPPGGLLPLSLVTSHPLCPHDHPHRPTCLPFPCPGPGPPCRLAPPCLGGKLTSEKLLGEEAAAKSRPIASRRKSQSLGRIWMRRLVAVLLIDFAD